MDSGLAEPCFARAANVQKLRRYVCTAGDSCTGPALH